MCMHVCRRVCVCVHVCVCVCVSTRSVSRSALLRSYTRLLLPGRCVLTCQPKPPLCLQTDSCRCHDALMCRPGRHQCRRGPRGQAATAAATRDQEQVRHSPSARCQAPDATGHGRRATGQGTGGGVCARLALSPTGLRSAADRCAGGRLGEIAAGSVGERARPPGYDP